MKRGDTFTNYQEMVVETCCSCGMSFAMTAEFKRQKLDARGTKDAWFYCPAGHNQYYLGKTDAQKLQEQLDEERRLRQRAEQTTAMWIDAEREASEEAKYHRHRAAAYKGHATRITKRAKAGVCPCCNRTFQQLARHMATQHPTFTPMEVDDVPPRGKALQ